MIYYVEVSISAAVKIESKLQDRKIIFDSFFEFIFCMEFQDPYSLKTGLKTIAR